MKIEEIEELRKVYLSQEFEELYEMDIEQLHHELHPLIKHRDSLENAKKLYTSRANETLKLIKTRLLKVTTLIDERGN